MQVGWSDSRISIEMFPPTIKIQIWGKENEP